MVKDELMKAALWNTVVVYGVLLPAYWIFVG